MTPEEQAAIGRLRLAEVKWVAAYEKGRFPIELKDEPWIQDLQHAAKIALREHPAADETICVSTEDAEWAIRKFVKPNTMRAIIDRLKKRSR